MRARNTKKCRFQVELLEGRIPPSALGLPITGAAQVAPRTVPYKESVTLVSPPGGQVSTYIGNATHMGRITIVTTIQTIDSNGTIHQTFTRVAANGDTMFGNTVVTPTGKTTGVIDTLDITVTGGTGRFAGVTGAQTGTVSVDPDGVTTAEATGTLTFS